MIGKISKRKGAPRIITAGGELGEDLKNLESSIIDSEKYFASEAEQPTYTTTLWESITSNGRVSKKLFEKIILPRISKLEKQNEILQHGLDNVYLFGKCLASREYAREALKKLKDLK